MTYFAVAVVLVVLSFGLWWQQNSHKQVLQALNAYREALSVPSLPQDYGPELKELREDLDHLRLAVAEGIQHVERAEKRIAATVRRARKELEESGYEHDGLEAEARDLHLIDGGGGGSEGLSAMPQSVESDESSVPGVSREALRRVRGL